MKEITFSSTSSSEWQEDPSCCVWRPTKEDIAIKELGLSIYHAINETT